MSPRSTLCKFLVLWLLLPGIVAPMRLAAQTGMLQHRRKAFRTAPGITYLVQENFEGAGLPSGWTATNVTHDYDYTTTPPQGLESYRQNRSASSPTLLSPTFTASSPVEAYFLYRPMTAFGTTQRVFFILNGTSECVRVSINTSGGFQVRAGGGTEVSTTDTMTINTTYHVWVRYVKGTGTDAFASVAFSTTGTRPTSGNAYRESTNGTATLDADRVRLGIANSSTFDQLFDRILVSTSSIPNSP